MVVGVTGPPGAGKSTLVAQLAASIRRQGRTVGIIAVDPSSPYSHGAILGDRIRMQLHHDDPGVFIRSMATRGRLGGLAGATFDLTMLLDAAGCDVILVETVGVGQDEVDVVRLADLTLLVLPPGLGDDVQAMKAGMMEIASIFVVNKADLPRAQQLEDEIRSMQSLGASREHDHPVPLHQVVATEGRGVTELLSTMDELFRQRTTRERRTGNWSLRLREMLRDRLSELVSEDCLEAHARKVADHLEDPYAAVEAISAELIKNTRKTVAGLSAPPEEPGSSLPSGGAHPRPLRE